MCCLYLQIQSFLIQGKLYIFEFFFFCANIAFSTYRYQFSLCWINLVHSHLYPFPLAFTLIISLMKYHCIRDLSITIGKPMMFVTFLSPSSFFFIAFITMCHWRSQHQLEHKLHERKFVFFFPLPCQNSIQHIVDTQYLTELSQAFPVSNSVFSYVYFVLCCF